MSNESIKWNNVPDILSLDQFRQICHISKSTARFLLKSGKVPCINTGKKTRCYKILKRDVKTYYEDREHFPEYYMASRGWYAKNAYYQQEDTAVPVIREDMHDYYTYLLRDYPDVLVNTMISEITGYSKTAINNWCKKGWLQHFSIRNQNMIPKVYLIDFFCSKAFRTITRKSEWHKKALRRFPEWHKLHSSNVKIK